MKRESFSRCQSPLLLQGSEVLTLIDFDEELKKFHPSLEVDDTEEAVMSRDEPDVLDLMFSMLGIKYKEKE